MCFNDGHETIYDVTGDQDSGAGRAFPGVQAARSFPTLPRLRLQEVCP